MICLRIDFGAGQVLINTQLQLGLAGRETGNRFNGFGKRKTVKTVQWFVARRHTSLKRGVNERSETHGKIKRAGFICGLI